MDLLIIPFFLLFFGLINSDTASRFFWTIVYLYVIIVLPAFVFLILLNHLFNLLGIFPKAT